MGEKDFSDRTLVGDDSLSYVSGEVFRAVRDGVSDPFARAELLAEIDRAREVVERVLPSLTNDRLDAVYPETVAGRPMYTRDFLMHLLSHLAYHLGQVDYHRRIATADAATVDAIALSELGIS